MEHVHGEFKTTTCILFNQIQIRRLFGIFNKILENLSGTRAVI